MDSRLFMVRSRLNFILLILMVFCCGISPPALAEDQNAIKAKEASPGVVYTVPDMLQVQSKTTWSAKDWLAYGNELFSAAYHNDQLLQSTDKKFAGFAVATVGDPDPDEIRMNALKAYNEGLKKVTPDVVDPTAAALWEGKASTYHSLGAGNMAIDALDKALKASADNADKVNRLQQKERYLLEMGRNAEATKVQGEWHTLDAKLRGDSDPYDLSFSPIIMVAGVLCAVILFAMRGRTASKN
jgi:tetratricopeptide (TPR) repeat protein